MNSKISIFTLCLSLTLLSFSITSPSDISLEGEKIMIINDADLVVSVDTKEGLEFFSEAEYEREKGDIKFKTTSKVERITVFKKNKKLVYVLPVKTKKIIIGKSLFEKGDYDLIFKVADINKNYTTKLEVK